jgi:hypothetical protein
VPETMKTKNTNIVRVKAIQLKLGLGALTIILLIHTNCTKHLQEQL